MATNIVTAAFCGSKVVRTRALYQWDYGQILQFEGLDLPSAYTVHFSNVGVGGTAKTQVGNADGVDIPDEYLTTGQTVYAWVYLHAGADDGETVYAVIIPVTQRPQPTEDEPTPVQQGMIDQAIAALTAGVEAAEDAAESAEQIAEDLGDFETAMAAVEAAKIDAEQSATEAADSATAAAASEAAARAVEESIPADYSELSADVSDLKTEIKTKQDIVFVTPEMFGAVGDGETDDTKAINDAIGYAITHGMIVRFNPKTYGVIPATHKDGWNSRYYCAFPIEHSVTIDLNNATLQTLSHGVAYWSMFRVFNFNDRNGQIAIKNGKLVGDKVNGATGDYYDSTQLISIKDSTNVIIDNVALINSKGDGLGFGGQMYGDPYPDYPFEDFYMGNIVRNCIIDGSNRNGISIGKCRGVLIENCVIKNTTGVNPKLGVDMEPAYGKGNVYDVTFKNCFFSNNTNGSISGYSPDGITIEDCTGDGGLYFRNCSQIKTFGSTFASFYANGADTIVDNCRFTGNVIAQVFTTTFSYVPSVLVSNSTFAQFSIGVPSSAGTKYSKVVLDNCAIKATNVPINGAQNGYYDLCDTFIVQNCTSETDGSDDPRFGLFNIRKIADVVIFKNNTIKISGGNSFYAYVGVIGNPIKQFEFVGNTVIFDPIEEGTTRNAKTLFYDYVPDTDSNVVIANNIVNIEGNAINTSNNTKAIFDTTTAYVHIFARNNIFRKINKLNLSDTATIEENISNLYGDLPTTWDGDMNVFAGGTSGQFLTKNSNSSFDFAWVTVPSANGVSF